MGSRVCLICDNDHKSSHQRFCKHLPLVDILNCYDIVKWEAMKIRHGLWRDFYGTSYDDSILKMGKIERKVN